MTRRELIQLAASFPLYYGLANRTPSAQPRRPADLRLFFEVEDVPLIRANANSPMLKAMYDSWRSEPLGTLDDAFEAYARSGDFIRDFQSVTSAIERCAMVQLINPSVERETVLLNALERLVALPHWDYFLDGGTEILGIQRAPYAMVRVLLAREVLGDAIGADLDRRVLRAVAEKGCAASYSTVFDMDNPETVVGWDFDELHTDFYDISMERWPTILGANNLRAAPTGALGLGALVLQNVDDRAQAWLEAAVQSTQRFLKLISADGSYFEGLSYLDYSLRTLLPFMEAHRRIIGDVDWASHVNFDGMLEYVLTMQMGRRSDGSPDIVNFSDANRSVFPGGMSLIGDYTGNDLAGFVAASAGHPRWFYDLLWYKPDAPTATPQAALLNKRNDLNWIICRTGWDAEDTVLAFKSGAPANHEHADRNHITLKAHGERLLNDHRGAAYDRRHDGWKMRLTEAHNAVLVDGRGHHYVDGIEGTNDSKAFATITQYEDRADIVWWTSDASAGYIVENYHAHQVQRTVLFAKPDIVIVYDQVRLRYRPQTVAARYYPDNSDGNGGINTDGSTFVINRPGASLRGLVTSEAETVVRASRLDVPAEVGDFPCVEVFSPASLEHRFVTVLSVARQDMPVPDRVRRLEGRFDGTAFRVVTPGLSVSLTPTAHAPVVEIAT